MDVVRHRRRHGRQVVNWQFTTSFEEKGDYRMTVRAKTADGMVSPLAATLLFEVA